MLYQGRSASALELYARSLRYVSLSGGVFSSSHSILSASAYGYQHPAHRIDVYLCYETAPETTNISMYELCRLKGCLFDLNS